MHSIVYICSKFLQPTFPSISAFLTIYKGWKILFRTTQLERHAKNRTYDLETLISWSCRRVSYK